MIIIRLHEVDPFAEAIEKAFAYADGFNDAMEIVEDAVDTAFEAGRKHTTSFIKFK